MEEDDSIRPVFWNGRKHVPPLPATMGACDGTAGRDDDAKHTWARHRHSEAMWLLARKAIDLTIEIGP
jgi:hypothetical protein